MTKLKVEFHAMGKAKSTPPGVDACTRLLNCGAIDLIHSSRRLYSSRNCLAQPSLILTCCSSWRPDWTRRAAMTQSQRRPTNLGCVEIGGFANAENSTSTFDAKDRAGIVLNAERLEVLGLLTEADEVYR